MSSVLEARIKYGDLFLHLKAHPSVSRLKKEDDEIKIILGYTVRLSPKKKIIKGK